MAGRTNSVKASMPPCIGKLVKAILNGLVRSVVEDSVEGLNRRGASNPYIGQTGQLEEVESQASSIEMESQARSECIPREPVKEMSR